LKSPIFIPKRLANHRLNGMLAAIIRSALDDETLATGLSTRTFYCPDARSFSGPTGSERQEVIISPMHATRIACAFLSMALLVACVIPQPALAAEGCVRPPTSPLVLNVRQEGAKGDGRTDDTAALQAAFDKIAGTGGTVFVPDGVYMVDAVSEERRLKIKDDTTVKLSSGATLKVIPNGAKTYFLLTIAGSSNVTVTGGTLEGDRAQHSGTEGEWGLGMIIAQGSKNVTVSGVTSRNMWGDGFTIAAAQNITFCSVVADHNRRQGLSVTEVNQLEVTNSVFSNTQGTRPSAGIDLEPDDVKQRIRNVRIRSSKFLNNKGPGILVAGKKNASLISELEITENLFVGEVPLKIEYSPEVLQSGICRNRQIVRQVAETGNLSTYQEPKEVLVIQHQCGDSGLQVRR
jgi:hypothetical protein